MTVSERVLVCERVIFPDGVRAGYVHIGADGRIAGTGSLPLPDSLAAHCASGGATREDLRAGLSLLPGVVDAHVHINDPGRSHWEGFDTATRAAAAGGITTLVDMPLNSLPPTVSEENLAIKARAARGCVWVAVAFWGGVIPENAESGPGGEITKLIDAGVRGFKCFLCESGVDEFPRVEREQVESAARTMAAHDKGSVFLFHAEYVDDEERAREAAAAESAAAGAAAPDPKAYSTFLASRPPSLEVAGIRLAADVCERTRQPCHIVHLSAASALPMIREYKARGVPLTVETCHHYLTLVSEKVPEGATEYKCCPPVRDAANREALWEALKDGTIDMVVSDHSPSVGALKCFESGDFMRAWGGISSLQFGLSLMHNNCVERGVPIERLVEWMCVRTSEHAGLSHRKGRLAQGCDADIVIFEEGGETVIETASIEHKNKATPFLGMRLKGKVIETICRGETVFKNGALVCPEPRGEVILETRASKV